MKNTQAELSDTKLENLVTFYQYGLLKKKFKPAPIVNNSWKWAGGGFISTTEDVIRFLEAHTKQCYQLLH